MIHFMLYRIAGQASYVKTQNKFEQSSEPISVDAEIFLTYIKGLSKDQRTDFIQTLGLVGMHCDDVR